jgi:hypothetical protein
MIYGCKLILIINIYEKLDCKKGMFSLHPALRGVLNSLITAVWCHFQYFSYIEVVSFIVEETGVLGETISSFLVAIKTIIHRPMAATHILPT